MARFLLAAAMLALVCLAPLGAAEETAPQEPEDPASAESNGEPNTADSPDQPCNYGDAQAEETTAYMGSDKRLYVTVNENGPFLGHIQAGKWVSVSCTIDPILRELEGIPFP